MQPLHWKFTPETVLAHWPAQRALAALATDRRRLVGLRDGARRLAAAVFDRETTSARFATWLEAVAVGMTDELT